LGKNCKTVNIKRAGGLIMHIIDYIRIALSLLLLYGVYTETGIWTTILLFLVVATAELKSYLDFLSIIKRTSIYINQWSKGITLWLTYIRSYIFHVILFLS